MSTPLQNVCSLNRGQLAERARQWTEMRRLALRSASRGEAGIFEYEHSREVEKQLRALVEAERRCCAVEGVAWDLERRADSLVLTVTIPESLRDSNEVSLIFAVIGGSPDERHHEPSTGR